MKYKRVRMVEHPMSFTSSSFGLTYSNPEQQLAAQHVDEHNVFHHADSTLDALMGFLRTPSPTHRPTRVIVSQELHEDGSFHYHALVQFDNRITVDHEYFNFQGVHPNIQVLRNPFAWEAYVKKDGTFQEWVFIMWIDDDEALGEETQA